MSLVGAYYYWAQVNAITTVYILYIDTLRKLGDETRWQHNYISELFMS